MIPSSNSLGTRPSLGQQHESAAAESLPANNASHAVNMMDKTASGMSLIAETFMKKGVPKMTAQVFLAKAGVFSNTHSAAMSWKQGDTLGAGLSVVKTVASLGTARYYNVADGLSNAGHAYTQYQAGDMRGAMTSGAKLALNAASLLAPPPLAIAVATIQVGMQFT